MLETYLLGLPHAPAYLVRGVLALAGFGWGCALFMGWMAAARLDGYPNRCSERELVLPITSVLLLIASPSMYVGDLIGFYLPFAARVARKGEAGPFARIDAWIGTYNPYDGANKGKRMPFAFYL